MPEESKLCIERLRVRSAHLGHLVNQSEVVRAGLIALENATDQDLQKCIDQLIRLEPGRPKHEGEVDE